MRICMSPRNEDVEDAISAAGKFETFDRGDKLEAPTIEGSGSSIEMIGATVVV